MMSKPPSISNDVKVIKAMSKMKISKQSLTEPCIF